MKLLFILLLFSPLSLKKYHKKKSLRINKESRAKFRGLVSNFKKAFNLTLPYKVPNLQKLRKKLKEKKTLQNQERTLFQLNSGVDTFMNQAFSEGAQARENIDQLGERERLEFDEKDPLLHDKISQQIEKFMNHGEYDSSLDLTDKFVPLSRQEIVDDDSLLKVDESKFAQPENILYDNQANPYLQAIHIQAPNSIEPLIKRKTKPKRRLRTKKEKEVELTSFMDNEDQLEKNFESSLTELKNSLREQR